MCGRLSFTESIESVALTYRARNGFDYPKRYNIAPSQMLPVITSNDGQHREIALKKWGLIPSWANDPSIGNHMINARAETITEKPSFKSAYQRQRCIIPASGFYEWKREGSIKQPYYFQATKTDFLSLAGLWESWEDPDQLIESFTIITTQANGLMSPIHDRMPVIIQPDYYEQWLNCREFTGQDVLHLMKPASDDSLLAHPVSRLVNSPANESWKCSQPIDR